MVLGFFKMSNQESQLNSILLPEMILVKTELLVVMYSKSKSRNKLQVKQVKRERKSNHK